MIRIKNALEIHLTIWVSTVIILPLFPMHKIIFASFFVFYAIVVLLRGRINLTIRTNAPLYIASIFLYGILLASFDSFDLDVTVQLMSSATVLLLFYIIYDSRLDFNRVILLSCYLFSVVTILLAIEGLVSGGGVLTNIVSKYNMVSLDERDIGFGDVLYSRLISLPIVFVAFSQLLYNAKFSQKVNYLGILLFSIVILISFTRALIFCWFAVIIFTMLYQSKLSKKILACTIFVLALVLVVSSGTLSLKETSNQTKLQDVSNFVTHISENPSVLVIGDGVGSYFYREGKGYYPKTENTVLDFFRFFGVPLTMLLFLILFHPFRFPINKETKYFSFCFFLYCLMSLSNPTLFNSFGCISILWYWYNIGIKADTFNNNSFVRVNNNGCNVTE